MFPPEKQVGNIENEIKIAGDSWPCDHESNCLVPDENQTLGRGTQSGEQFQEIRRLAQNVVLRFTHLPAIKRRASPCASPRTHARWTTSNPSCLPPPPGAHGRVEVATPLTLSPLPLFPLPGERDEGEGSCGEGLFSWFQGARQPVSGRVWRPTGDRMWPMAKAVG
jgi:hypothetical protein